MMYTAGPATTIPHMVSAFTFGVGWMNERVSPSVATSGNGPTDIRYVPLLLPAIAVVRRVWWANGATTTGGATVECGVYANTDYGPGARLVVGTATQGTASQVQFVDVTDTTLAPGLYWIGFTASTSTNTTFMRTTLGSSSWDEAVHQSETGTTLPATATSVEAVTETFYLFGFATTASP